MRVNLSESFWNTLNPCWDGHYGISGEFGKDFTPIYEPAPTVKLYPIMLKRHTGPEEFENRKAFAVFKGDTNIGVIRVDQNCQTMIITDASIYFDFNDKQIVLWADGERVIKMPDKE